MEAKTQCESKEQMAVIVEVVERMESYANEIFSGEYFTSITKFNDGDFRVVCRHGKGHKGSNDPEDLYRQDFEAIRYHHIHGEMIWSDETRYIDGRFNDIHDREVLEVINRTESEDNHE